MSTFQEAYNQVLDFANRPSSELLVQAKREVNAAVQWSTMSHQFLFAETTANLTYTSGSTSVATSSLAAPVQFIKSIDIIGAGQGLFGRPIKVVPFETLKTSYYRHKMRQSYIDEELEVNDPNTTKQSFEQLVRNSDEYLAYLLGENIGIFPLPSANLNLLIYYCKKLPILVADSDTNFLLENCMDFIVNKALSRFNFYLKENESFQVDSAQLTRDWEAVKAWDAQLRSSAGISLGSEM